MKTVNKVLLVIFLGYIVALIGFTHMTSNGNNIIIKQEVLPCCPKSEIRPTTKQPQPLDKVASKLPVLPVPSTTGNINVVYIIDKKLLEALPTSINSIWNTTERTVHIYVIFVDDSGLDPSGYLFCFFGALEQKNIHIIIVDNALKYIDKELMDHMNRRGVPRYTTAKGNYIRPYLHRIMPLDVDHAIYLDVDVILMDNIGTLWDLSVNHSTILSPVWKFKWKPDTYMINNTANVNITTWARSRLGWTFPRKIPYFNNGIFGINLKRLRQKHSTMMKSLRVWALGDTLYRWFALDTQDLMNFAYFGETTSLPAPWNIQIRYYNRTIIRKRPVSLLHFTGKEKPWFNSSVPFQELWQNYVLDKCSGHGTCEPLYQTDMFYCSCKANFSGELCQNNAPVADQTRHKRDIGHKQQRIIKTPIS